MGDLSAARTPLAEKSRSTSKPIAKKTNSQARVDDFVRVSPNENCAPALSTKAPCDQSATIAMLKKECEDLKKELEALEAEREEEQQDILRARAALEEKEYQVRPFLRKQAVAQAVFWSGCCLCYPHIIKMQSASRETV